MKFKHRFLLFAVLVPLFCKAASSNGLVTECVGNVDMVFPSDVEVAANSTDMLIKEHDIGTIQPVFEFPDGEKSGWTSMHYNGKLFVSHFLNDKEDKKIFQLQEKRKEIAKQFASRQAEKGIGKGFEEVDIVPARGVAFHVGGSFSTSVFARGHMLWLQSSVKDSDASTYKKDLADFVKNLSFRPIGFVPKSSGLCFPYFFAAVEPGAETKRRKISATYRLKQHPDVIIWIEDSNPTVSTEKAEKDSPRNRINEFWTQYENNPGIEKIESEWSSPSGRKVAIGNSDGLASFVRIKRKGGVVDYGYMATARGDVRQKNTASDINLFVIRKAENAAVKGVTPVTAEEFIKLSQEIVSTIKIRTER